MEVQGPFRGEGQGFILLYRFIYTHRCIIECRIFTLPVRTNPRERAMHRHKGYHSPTASSSIISIISIDASMTHSSTPYSGERCHSARVNTHHAPTRERKLALRRAPVERVKGHVRCRDAPAALGHWKMKERGGLGLGNGRAQGWKGGACSGEEA